VPLYVGQTGNLKQRMDDHRANRAHCIHRHSPTWVVVEVVADERLRLAREQQLIAELDPPCNKT
jgi:predicted GIY-YIG superfamily endonuclease